MTRTRGAAAVPTSERYSSNNPTNYETPRPAAQRPAQRAVRTVTRQGDGSIRVTIRELRDPAELQDQLRAGGVPAKCHAYRPGESVMSGLHGEPGTRKRVLSMPGPPPEGTGAR